MNISWNILSKYRNELYGISILWIILFHGLELKNFAIDKSLTLFAALIKHGNCGVDIFLFLSGLCLYYSMKNDGNIYSFYKKRLKRILLPFLLIDGFYWLYVYILQNGDVLGFIKNITLYAFWFENNHFVWFIALIIPLYFLYPLLFKYILNNNKINRFYYILCLIVFVYLLCIAVNYFNHEWYLSVELALPRIPVFLAGAYCGILAYDSKLINMRIKICSFIFVLIAIGYFYVHPIGLIKSFRIPYFFFAPSIAIWISIVLEVIASTKVNRVLCLWGDFRWNSIYAMEY